MIKAQKFWNWFKQNEAKYFFLNQIDSDIEKENILNELEEHIHLYCENLFFEIGGDLGQKNDLIITAQGDEDFFKHAEFLVEQAPKLEYWNIIALKPIVENSQIEYNNIVLTPETMWFIPLSNEKSTKIGLRVYLDNFDNADKDDLLFATYLVIDNILGEKSSGLDIGYVEIKKIPQISERDELIELSELPEYVKWKKNKNDA